MARTSRHWSLVLGGTVMLMASVFPLSGSDAASSRGAGQAGGAKQARGAENRTFDISTEFGGWTRTANQGGRARFRGAVTFHGRFHIDMDVSWLQDECSSAGGDGIGAKAYGSVFLRKLPTPS